MWGAGGGYSIFTIFSQEAKPGWDSGQVPPSLPGDKNKLFPNPRMYSGDDTTEQWMKPEVSFSHK